MSISFFKLKNVISKAEKRQWNNQEIADFYRAVDILKRAGLDVEVDSGITDEGDPWFVFVRSGDGEVLAHFAQIDGQFVAVSSLNHEVYKGADIRQIVDRMLDQHPLVVPKNKSSAQLYLHPTAAVTAFLAAALLLNIEGIKPTKVEEILVAVSTKGSSALADLAVSVQANGKGDTAKWGQLDVASANYNVVILGAALIAHELGSSKVEGLNAAEMEIASIDVTGDIVKMKAENETGIISKELPDSLSEGSRITEQDIGQVGLKLENKSEEIKIASSKMNPKEDQKTELDLSQRHFSDQNVAELSGSFINQWEAPNLQLKGRYPSNNKNQETTKTTPYDASANLVRVEQIFSEEDNEKGIPSTLLTEESETPVFNLDLAALVDIENSRITADYIDSMSSIAFQGMGLTSDMFFLDKPSQNVYDGDSTLSLSSIGKQLEVSQVTEGSSTAGTNIAPVPQLPIVGHATIESRDVVDMTSGIDVVFYQGGDVKIKGFELGVDLLWFFLSEDELRTGQNSVNSAGDVVLDFGEKGSLVFVGLVPNSSDDIFV